MNAPGNELNLENIWKENKFAAKTVPGFFFLANGEHFTKNQKGKITSYHLLTGDEIETIFDAENDAYKSILNGPVSNYSFSADEQKLLILVHQEAIYRRSSKANVFFFDRKTVHDAFIGKNALC